MNLKISVAQLNLCVGDLPGNARLIIDAARQAYSEGARLVLTPELSICGYAAEDLFLRPAFIIASKLPWLKDTNSSADFTVLSMVFFTSVCVFS